MSRMVRLPVAQVIVTGRHRTDLGDIDALAQSILAVGLLHPIVVDEKHRLIAGERRLAAWQKLHDGREAIPAHVVKTVDSARLLLIAERDENTCRKEMTPSEAVALGLALEAIEKPAAKERQQAGGGGTGSGKLPEPSAPVRDRVAPAVGMSPRTYEKAKAVVAAAEDKSAPADVREVAREAVEQMDATGRVDGAFRKVMDAQSDAVLGEAGAKRERLRTTASRFRSELLSHLLSLDPERVAAAIPPDEWDEWDATASATAKWFAALKGARPDRLRAVK